MPNPADVCLVLEGTYPYVSGGVSNWTHDLLEAQPHLNFHLVCIVPRDATLKQCFTLPKNVVGVMNLFIQQLPTGALWLPQGVAEKLFQALEVPLLNLQHSAELPEFQKLIRTLRDVDAHLGKMVLLNSRQAWRTLVRMYSASMGETSFLDYFWTWRGLMGGFFSILLADLPPAKIYHALCTGYAGLYVARAKVETSNPCLLTEHGIYTNERRIEITAAEWLHDQRGLNLNVNRRRYERDLRDFWIDTFTGYARLCYKACDKIITISDANKEMELADGADPGKLGIIPNGVDYNRFGNIPRALSDPPTIALIGRIVPIKDVKTFLHAVALVKQRLPKIRAWIIGPHDEDLDYYQECVALTQAAELSGCVTFTGKVKVEEYLPQIDVLVLTSISEGQPLVVLEAGAAGIPVVCTNVGDCHDLVYGRKNEDPPLGAGGAITLLTDPNQIARNVLELLTDPKRYHDCSKAMKTRVETYYRKEQQDSAYRQLYEGLLKKK